MILYKYTFIHNLSRNGLSTDHGNRKKESYLEYGNSEKSEYNRRDGQWRRVKKGVEKRLGWDAKTIQAAAHRGR